MPYRKEMVSVRHEATMCMIIIVIAVAMISYLGASLVRVAHEMVHQQQAQYIEIMDEAVPMGQ